MQHQQYSQKSLSRLDSLILNTLVDGPKHAVALREALEQATGLFIEPGTLHRVVTHLEQRGWIEGLEAEGQLRPYRITTLGIFVLQRVEAGSHREQEQEGESSAWCRKEIIVHLVIWMIRLYPPAWRERYEAEMVALLEQHEITFWTMLDLLGGALDARLDPHYRRSHRLVPLRRLETSWGLMAGACVAFWLTFFFWIIVSNVEKPDELSRLVETLAPVIYATLKIITILAVPLLPLVLAAILTAIPVWIVVQTLEKNVWNALRFLPMVSFLILFPFLSWWQQDVLSVILIADLTVESGGLLLTIGRRWLERHRRLFPLLALLVTVGMLLMCIVNGFWTVAVWKLLPSPNWQTSLILELVLMMLATTIALFGLVRGSLALRAVSAAPPKQEPLQHVHEQG